MKIYHNFEFIFSKIKQDGYLQIIHDSLNSIFVKEISFAINELCNLKKTNPNINIKELFKKNLLVFKENLKIVLD